MTNSQQYLSSIGLDKLIDTIEVLIQKNPYNIKSIEHDLWNEFAEKNIPFLIVLSNFIRDQYSDKNFTNILYTTRDCIFLKHLFNKLYPYIATETFYASRALYLFPTKDYMEYCKKLLTPTAVVIDFQGTGQSFKNLVSSLKLEPWYLLVNWNAATKLDYSQTYLHDYNKKIIIRSKNYFDDAIEKLNIDLVGTYFDYYDNKPVSYAYEYNTNLVSSIHKCFELFISLLDQNSIELFQAYTWSKEFNWWMDNHYANHQLFNKIQWIHTHFRYEEDSINRIRNDYKHAKSY